MKKRFAFLLIGIIILMSLTFVLQILFNNQTQNFGTSCGILFLSIFCLFGYKNALKPQKSGWGGSINMTKKYYQKNGELDKYQNLCKILFIITLTISLLLLMTGLAQIFINYLKSVFAN